MAADSRLERFVGELQETRTLDELQRLIVRWRSQLGVDHLVYHSVNSTGQQYAALTYAPQWVNRYISEEYARIDPVVQGCFQRFHPVDWKRLDWSGKSRRSSASRSDAGSQAS